MFPEIYRATVSAGEQSGRLDEVLERLSDYTESRQVMRQKVSNALVYPIVLLVMSFAIVSFLLVYVVPQVVAVFESGHQQAAARDAHPDRHESFRAALLDIRRDDRSVLAAWGFARWLKKPESRLRFDRCCLRVPLAGKLIRGLNTARFARTFSILTASAVPVLEALEASPRTSSPTCRCSKPSSTRRSGSAKARRSASRSPPASCSRR